MLNWLSARWHRWRRFAEGVIVGSLAASLATGAAYAAERGSLSRPYVDLSKPSRPIMLGDIEILYLEVMLNQTRQPQLLRFERRGRTAWNVSLNDGQNVSGSTRRMRLGATGNYVTYELYRDPARTQRWGVTTGSDTVPGTGTGSAQNLTVYGRVPASQTVPAGSYSDVVTITVTY